MPLDQDEQNVAAVATEEVVSTETVENQPEPTLEQDEKPAKESEDEDHVQKGVQKRIDRLTRQKYEARAEADFLRKQLEAQQQPRTDSVIDRGRFESEEDYIEAVVEARLSQKEAVQQQQSFAQKVNGIIKEAEKLGDFDVDDFREIPISQAMAMAIVESDVAVKLTKYFHDEPEEAERISRLSPARQAAAIGILEVDLGSSVPKVTAKSAAPSPIKPVAGNGVTQGGYRPDMTPEAYRKWRRGNK